MKRCIGRAGLAMAMIGLCVVFSDAARAGDRVQVFILAGQSNMEGKGAAEHLNKYLNDPELGPRIKVTKSGDQWKKRDDVRVVFNDPSRQGPLTVGWGDKGKIGPEFGFGHCVGEKIAEDVLLIKCAWGGKTLVGDFRPPSAGGEVGSCYTQMVSIVHETLKNVKDYEIVGFVWFQGFNDQCMKTPADTYCELMGHLLRDLRKEFKAPKMLLVTGGMGHGGKAKPDNDVNKGQQSFVAQDEFKDSTRYVPTKEYWNEEASELYAWYRRHKKEWNGSEQAKRYDEITSDRPYHYFGDGKFFFRVGWLLGEAMLELMAKQK